MQELLEKAGIASCSDWDSWLPTGRCLKNAKARSFIPSLDLLLSDIGAESVNSFSAYLQGAFSERFPLVPNQTRFTADPASGVQIPQNVIAAFQKGTGLYWEEPDLRRLVMTLPEPKRVLSLGNALQAVGRVPGREVCPLWKQHEYGRVYCSNPPGINMPKKLLPALQSINGLPLYNVDFANFEPRIACSIVGQWFDGKDLYGTIRDTIGISRDRVKDVLNPMLHGQTSAQWRYQQRFCPETLGDRPLVEAYLASDLPFLFRGIATLRANASLLQSSGATVFFACMSAALNRCEIVYAGLPKHDGWVFAATPSQAEAVKAAFEATAERITGAPMPIKLEPCL